jgi:hypothetical protein
MFNAAGIRLNALLARRFAARLRGGHLLGAALRTHLAATFFLVGAKELLRYKTRESWRTQQGEKRRDSTQSDAQWHAHKVYRESESVTTLS